MSQGQLFGDPVPDVRGTKTFLLGAPRVVAPSPRPMPLSEAEVAEAAVIGGERAARAKAKGWNRGVYTTRSNEDRHTQAAIAECWVARQLGLVWEQDPNAFKAKPDVQPDVDVRCIGRPGNWLHVMANDPPGRRMVAVSGRYPNLKIEGWCWTQDAPTIGRWVTKPGANKGGVWAVSPKALQPLSALLSPAAPEVAPGAQEMGEGRI